MKMNWKKLSKDTPKINVYVGGRKTKRLKPFEGGSITDVYNAFHTSRDKKEAESFGKTKKLSIDISKTPKERIFRKEDWTKEMVNIFKSKGIIMLKHIKKARPDIYQYLKKLGYNRYISTNMISDDKIFDVFEYPDRDKFNINRGTLIENEVAIFDKSLLKW